MPDIADYADYVEIRREDLEERISGEPWDTMHPPALGRALVGCGIDPEVVSDILDPVSSSDRVEQIIYDVTMGYISIEEAARRMNILEDDPGHLTCSTCRKFRDNLCIRPGYPIRSEHPGSFRCGDYERRDPRDEAMPLDLKTENKMFK